MSLVYSFVSRDTVILAEYSAYSGNFASAALEWLEKAHHPGPFFTISADGRSFSFLLRGYYTFAVVGEERSEQQMMTAFLELVANDFLATYGTKASSAPERSLSRRFSPVLKAHMEFVMSHPDEESRIAALQHKAEEVKNVMVENIERVLQESGRFEVEDSDTGELREETKSFSVWSRAERRRFRCRAPNFWCLLIATVLALVLLAAVALVLCFVWDHCIF